MWLFRHFVCFPSHISTYGKLHTSLTYRTSILSSTVSSVRAGVSLVTAGLPEARKAPLLKMGLRYNIWYFFTDDKGGETGTRGCRCGGRDHGLTVIAAEGWAPGASLSSSVYCCTGSSFFITNIKNKKFLIPFILQLIFTLPHPSIRNDTCLLGRRAHMPFFPPVNLLRRDGMCQALAQNPEVTVPKACLFSHKS